MTRRFARLGLLLALTPLMALPLRAADSTAAPAPAVTPSPAATPAPPTAPAPGEKLPVDSFARLPFVEYPSIAPDGTHWAGLLGLGGIQSIAIFNLFEKPAVAVRIMVPDQTNVRWMRWANADNVLVGLDALVRVTAEDWYVRRLVSVNRVTGKVSYLLWDVGGQNASDVIWMPNKAGNEVLVAAQNSIYQELDWWPAVHQVDITNGHDHVVVAPHPGISEWMADGEGTVRAGVGYDDSRRTSRLVYRPAGSRDSFRTVDRASERKGESLLRPFLFLPGGDHALVMHDNDKGMASIYEVDLATQADVRTVYEPPSGEVEDVVVSDDGSTLLGVAVSDHTVGLHWIDPGLAALQVELQKSVSTAGVLIESVSSDRSRMLVGIGAPDMPGQLSFLDLKDGVLHRLAFINEAIGSRHLAPVKLVHYQARDGLKIEAVLTLPVGREPKNLPFIVLPHGGPWAQDSLDYDYWAQFLANRGYGVLQPNFRGSTGYGTSFMHAGEGQLGLAMQDDVTDGVKWAVSQGLADEHRVCIVGASYGGYAAMWGIAKDPDQYRCAISIAGVSSLKREVNDFTSTTQNISRDAWERMAPNFDAVSPINAIDRLKTPLLLIHGKKDITVSYAHSSKMYDKMRKAGKSVEFVSLPLADHHFTRQEDRVALLSAMEAFLAKYNPAD
ncbi:MAG TPA: S9 family peptidase [Steroidobacteraceae bacterium]|nr:S9 family peptidase [Steroidobacteraceae bacterium]